MQVLLALCAALVYGSAVAAQHHEAALADSGQALNPRLLLGLAVRPLWLLGMLGDIGGFLLQTAALAVGSVVIVQSILTLNLVVALLVGSRLSRRRLARGEWWAVAGTLVGLGVFLAVADPTSHSDAQPSGRSWWTMLAIVGLATAAAVGFGRRASGTRRAVLLALGAACAEAVMAVMAKALGDRVSQGVLSTLTSWEPYAVLAAGLTTLLLVQSAYNANRMTVTLPILTVAEPVVAIAIGAALFDERAHLGGARGVVVLVAVATVLVSLIVMARRSAGYESATVRVEE
jgi:drug/metabolite transporter (DMT)-like permease